MKRCPYAMVMRLAATISLVVASIDSINTSHASTWTGTDGNWTSNSDPGWNGTGVPMNAGDVADNPIAIPANTFLDASGVTVGTISLSGDGQAGWTISKSSNDLTLDQDGGGPGHATISNSNTSAFGLLSIRDGTLILADDLLIENTSNSAVTGTNNGAIRITSAIAGTGNVRIRSTAPAFPSGVTNTSYPGSILIFNGTPTSGGPVSNTFTGNVFVEKGLVMYNNPASFGANTNIITVGKAGDGDASLLMSGIAPAGAQNIAYGFVVAAGSGGTLMIGSLSGSSSSLPTYTGSVTLNDNVTIISRHALTGSGNQVRGQRYSGAISGIGGITKVGGDNTGTGNVTLSGDNTYEGNTIVLEGAIHAFGGNAIPNGAGKGNVHVASGASFRINDSETINGLFGQGGGFGTVSNTSTNPQTLTIGDGDVNSTFDGLIEDGKDPFSGGGANNSGALGIAKLGAGTLTLGSANTYTGTTAVNGGTLLVNNMHTGGDDYNVGVGGTLGGTGTISAPVFLDGTISPGTSPGTLTIGGLTANDGGTLSFDLDPANPNSTADDLLAVTGTAHLSAPILNVNVTSAAFGGGQFSTPGSWLLVDGALLTGTAPTTVNFNFVDGLSGVTPSLELDFINNDIRLVLAAGIAGDYNNDGVVDAADYVMWRKNPDGFGGDPAGYNTWRANFGTGGGASLVVATQVPEPAGCILLILSALLLCSCSRGGAMFIQRGM